MIETGKQYQTISGKTIAITGEGDRVYFHNQLVHILGIQKKLYEEQVGLVNEETVLLGLTTDLAFPSGSRHGKTGKCLALNIGGYKGDLEKLLLQWDIQGL